MNFIVKNKELKLSLNLPKFGFKKSKLLGEEYKKVSLEANTSFVLAWDHEWTHMELSIFGFGLTLSLGPVY